MLLRDAKIGRQTQHAPIPRTPRTVRQTAELPAAQAESQSRLASSTGRNCTPILWLQGNKTEKKKKVKRNKTKRIKQNKTQQAKRNRTKRNRQTKQNKTIQNNTKRNKQTNKTEQNRTRQDKTEPKLPRHATLFLREPAGAPRCPLATSWYLPPRPSHCRRVPNRSACLTPPSRNASVPSSKATLAPP